MIFPLAQHQIQGILYIRGAFCLWAYSNICLLIVCISPCFTAQKKLPLTSLSQAMVESGNQLGEDSLIGWVCDFSPGMHVANGSRCNPKGKETTHRQNVQLSVSFMTSLYWVLIWFFIVIKQPLQTRVKDLESVCSWEEVTCLSETNEEQKVRLLLNVLTDIL